MWLGYLGLGTLAWWKYLEYSTNFPPLFWRKCHFCQNYHQSVWRVLGNFDNPLGVQVSKCSIKQLSKCKVQLNQNFLTPWFDIVFCFNICLVSCYCCSFMYSQINKLKKWLFYIYLLTSITKALYQSSEQSMSLLFTCPQLTEESSLLAAAARTLLHVM